MGRGKIQLKRIENKASRQVTFSKRRTGLLKKANEISVLCDAEVALIVFNCKGKLTEFSSPSSRMDSILDRYERYSQSEQLAGTNNDSQGDPSLELFKLTTRAEVLEKNLRNYEGEDLDSLGLRELQSLERQLDNALKRIRTRKHQAMNESISERQRKAKALQDHNSMLTRKIKEKEKNALTIAEVPQVRQGTLDQCPINIIVSPPQLPPPPQLLLPKLTLGGTSEAGGAQVEEAEAQARPSNSMVRPRRMQFHLTR